MCCTVAMNSELLLSNAGLRDNIWKNIGTAWAATTKRL
jgi:hypothetical protein